MKHAGLTYPEVRSPSTHTNEILQQLLQKLCVCCAVHMPQHGSGRITFMEKKQSPPQSPLQSPFKLSSVKVIRKLLISANCDRSSLSVNTLQLGTGQKGYTKRSSCTSDSLLNHGFLAFNRQSSIIRQSLVLHYFCLFFFYVILFYGLLDYFAYYLTSAIINCNET